MTMDMFLHLNGIKGETQDKKEKDGIDILSWSWGISNSGTFHTGSGGGSGKASFRNISLVKYIDKATAALMIAAATGKHIPDGKIIVRKAGDSPQNYLVITMKKILVTSVDTGDACIIYGGFQDINDGAPEHMWLEHNGFIYDTMPGQLLRRDVANAWTRLCPPSEANAFAANLVGSVQSTLTVRPAASARTWRCMSAASRRRRSAASACWKRARRSS